MIRIVFTGGGTGGHIVPNIALIQTLLKKHPDAEILYMGSKKGPEATMIPEIGIKFKGIMTGKLRRYFSFKNFIDIFRIPVGIIQSIFILRKFKPQVVFSKGGYVSLPVIFAARFLKIPSILHESDVHPGLANRILGKRANLICLSFDETKDYFDHEVRKVFTGNPVREFILKGNKEKGYKITGFKNDQPVILVMGGSQGAAHINDALIKAIPEIKSQVIHITGADKKTGYKGENYKEFEYLNNELPHIYAISDLIISRAGANSIAEIDALGIPAILVPIGKMASRGEQALNAESYRKIHPETIIIEDESLNPETLKTAVTQLLTRGAKSTDRMNPQNASGKIIEVIEELLV